MLKAVVKDAGEELLKEGVEEVVQQSGIGTEIWQAIQNSEIAGQVESKISACCIVC